MGTFSKDAGEHLLIKVRRKFRQKFITCDMLGFDNLSKGLRICKHLDCHIRLVPDGCCVPASSKVKEPHFNDLG